VDVVTCTPFAVAAIELAFDYNFMPHTTNTDTLIARLVCVCVWERGQFHSWGCLVHAPGFDSRSVGPLVQSMSE